MQLGLISRHQHMSLELSSHREGEINTHNKEWQVLCSMHDVLHDDTGVGGKAPHPTRMVAAAQSKSNAK